MMKENQYFANRYKEVDTNTATPLHLVVMLYDAAICSLEEARGHMARKDISGRSRTINKCTSILSELQASLNIREGGDIASSLNRLYEYMKMTLLQAGVDQNPDMVVEVLGLLESLRSAWRQIDSGAAASTLEFSKMQSIENAGFPGNPQEAAESGYLSSFSISA